VWALGIQNNITFKSVQFSPVKLGAIVDRDALRLLQQHTMRRMQALGHNWLNFPGLLTNRSQSRLDLRFSQAVDNEVHLEHERRLHKEKSRNPGHSVLAENL